MGFLTLLTEGTTAPGETWFMHPLRMINVTGLASFYAVELVCCQPRRSAQKKVKISSGTLMKRMTGSVSGPLYSITGV